MADSLQITRLYSDLDLNFTAHPDTGDVSKKVDINAVKQSLQILMLTELYERPFQPLKGAGLRALLFEPMTPLVTTALEKTIKVVIENFEPRAKIQSLRVKPNYDANSYDITLEYMIVGITRPQILTTQLKRLR